MSLSQQYEYYELACGTLLFGCLMNLLSHSPSSCTYCTTSSLALKTEAAGSSEILVTKYRGCLVTGYLACDDTKS
jgi:hypothetical protein